MSLKILSEQEGNGDRDTESTELDQFDFIETIVSFDKLDDAHLFPRDPEFHRNLFEEEYM